MNMLPIINNHQSTVQESAVQEWVPKWLESKIKLVEHAGYRVVGPNKHSAIKVCQWTKEMIKGKNVCYKCKFYGIESNRCLQMTPVMFWCSFNCSFCWRNLGYTLPPEQVKWDSPKEIMNESIEAQRKLLEGYWGYEGAIKKRVRESMDPKHVAISLSGEPTMYPYLPELIDEILGRDMTAYLVTNGTYPDAIRKLITHQPTNLYISVYGTNPEMYKTATTPIMKNPFDKVLESLSLMKEFQCRTIVRLTLAKGLNFADPEGYAKIVEKSQTKFLEVKAFMAVGGSRKRMEYEDMPRIEEIRSFAETVEKNSCYQIVDEKVDSRVILLARNGVVDKGTNFHDPIFDEA